MRTIDSTLNSLEAKGHKFEGEYLQEGLGPMGGRMLIIFDGVAMSYQQARALDKGRMTLEQIAARNTQGN